MLTARVYDALTSEVSLIQLDRGSLAIFFYRIWQAVTGLITLVFITNFLSPLEQGYYYTFVSLAALQMILEMGLSIVLVQVAAHEFVGLSWGERGRLIGGSSERFLALIKKSIRWSGVAALFVLLLYPAGLFFIAATPHPLDYDWRGAWAILVIATGAAFIFQPILALVEGTGQVIEIYIVRLIQSVFGVLAAWMTLIMGGGLYAAAMMPAANALTAVIWLLIWRPHFLVQSIKAVGAKFSWKFEVWPMQWRIGLSWLSGYFLVQMHTPLLFRTQNALAAGQMGLTMSVSNMMGLLAMTYMTSQVPKLATAVANRDWLLLDRSFRKAFAISVLAFVFGAIGLLALRIALEWTPYGIRFLSVAETTGLVFAVMLSYISGLFAVYLRAHRREPLMWPSVIGAMLIAGGAIWTAPQWGAAGIVSVLVIVNLLFGLPVTISMWVYLRRKWHVE